jgi:hypothetical protein
MFVVVFLLRFPSHIYIHIHILALFGPGIMPIESDLICYLGIDTVDLVFVSRMSAVQKCVPLYNVAESR